MLGGLLACAGTAMAQQQPDAGRLLREQPKPPAKPIAKPAAPEPPAGELVDTGLRVPVKAFRIEGNTLVPEAELVEQVKGLIGKEAGFSDLRNAARSLVRYYARKGYSARVILPEQDIRDGVITLRVIEGRRGALGVDATGERIDAARLERFVERRLPAGAVMNLEALNEAIVLVNELPGVRAESVLSPGKGEREVDVRVRAEETPLFSYIVQANNQGSRGTGHLQGGFGVALNNPGGAYDRASLFVNASEGSALVRGEYGVAVGDHGLRLNASASQLAYHLTQSNFRALNARGTASTLGLSAAFPLTARSDFDHRLSGGFERKGLVDRTVNGETGNRIVQVVNAGTTVSFSDTLFGGGDVSAELRVYVGRTRQGNAAALAADRGARNVEGGYGKLEYALDRVQSLDRNWSVGFSLRGQAAGKNLDSSERMSLGGQAGVRAYPTGEAVGDHARVLALSLTRIVGEQLSASAFVDHGWVRLNHRIWPNWNAANPQLSNSYSLSGVGIGLNWTLVQGVSLNASIARRIGKNPGRDTAGNDADGSHPGTRAWIGLNAYF